MGRQLDLRPIADAILRLLEQIEQLRNRLARNLARLFQRTICINDAIDPAVRMVAVGIAQVMLKMAIPGCSRPTSTRT